MVIFIYRFPSFFFEGKVLFVMIHINLYLNYRIAKKPFMPSNFKTYIILLIFFSLFSKILADGDGRPFMNATIFDVPDIFQYIFVFHFLN